jgi:H+/Cl- antiporter ClcA
LKQSSSFRSGFMHAAGRATAWLLAIFLLAGGTYLGASTYWQYKKDQVRQAGRSAVEKTITTGREVLDTTKEAVGNAGQKAKEAVAQGTAAAKEKAARGKEATREWFRRKRDGSRHDTPDPPTDGGPG